MADASYDAVIIGGGHNGLIVACYLAYNGMSVAVFERQHELGGGACTEELVLPGFQSNPCAHFTRFYGSPAYLDFKLWEKGLCYNFTDLGRVAIFDDGKCLVVYPALELVDQRTGETRYSPKNAEKVIKEIARFSERDAETTAIIFEKYRRKWGDAIREWQLNPPAPWGEKDAVEKLIGDPQDGVDPIYQAMTVKQVAYDIYESREMRTYFMRSAMAHVGCYPDDVLAIHDYMINIGIAFLSYPYGALTGGTHNIAHALQRTLSEMGGKFFVHHEVDKITIEDNRATGVRLVDGTEVKARKLIVSNVDPAQTLLQFVGEEFISPQLARRVKNINFDSIALWVNFAIHDPPDWKVADFNPDAFQANRFYLLPNDPEFFAERFKMEVYTHGIAKKLYMTGGIDSMLDRTRAPEGKHIALIENYTAPARFFSEREWLQIKKDIVNETVRQWQWYAPNMTWDNIIAGHADTPLDVVNRNINMREGGWQMGAHTASQMGRFRPCPELSGYRTPIKNLYMCGACMHYGGGMRGINGYNCYKVIAEDFGLEKVWERMGHPY